MISVLVPTFRQAAFLTRSLEGLLLQSRRDWECLVVDDGSDDGTSDAIEPYLTDGRFRYHRFGENRGLGAALNYALDQASGETIAYLPSDDVYYRNHLETLAAALDANPDSVLAFSGVRHHYNCRADGQIAGYALQLVQVMHRRALERWMERDELVTDDLERMFWSRLRGRGKFVPTGLATCEWVDHPSQRHKRIREPEGGLNRYRGYFGVRTPLRFHSSAGSLTDENLLYARFRARQMPEPQTGALKIVLVGELAYNAERVLALEERGHKLYGLWMSEPYGYNTVGPLPFGNVEEIAREGWQQAVRRLRPDVFYGLLNWQAVPWAHYVMSSAPEVPFVWHFKEGPFICLHRGTWPMLADLYTKSAACVYCSPEMRDWLITVLPELGDDGRPWLVLDGDLPKCDWFEGRHAEKLSASDGEFHTVVPGRPIGLHPPLVKQMADEKIHLHFYGESTHGLWLQWIEKVNSLAPGYLHLHPNVDQRRWVAEFSRYDGGWLHFFESRNRGEIRRADWDDLNYPARIGPLIAAGLPLLQRGNQGAIVATQTLVRNLGVGLLFSGMQELGAQLRDHDLMTQVRTNVLRQREHFTFDAHCEELVALFRRAIEYKSGMSRGQVS